VRRSWSGRLRDPVRRRRYRPDRAHRQRRHQLLAASIWTRDLGIAHKLARRIKAGTVWVNTHNFGDPALPFGGYKQSGWGREMGYEAIELYTEVKAVVAAL
jgi:acyl-CoA reductase-like NAD-dependent aldehyde dehydrogenase